ncbi:Leucine-rich repeat-containing protein 3 [Branchiostoma belcheri]|nr:Leucine-rich repeat-containing protein 3 [Branchiostoma belcheri]
MAELLSGIILVAWVHFATLNAADTACPYPCTCTDSYGELTVSCSGQGLTEVPSNIPTSVVWLNLKYNNITTLTDNSFSGLKNLRGVDLSNNKLNYISTSAFRQLLHLQNVDLSGNQLTTLAEEVFNFSIVSARQDQRRFFVYMSENPWKCDCRILWLAKLLQGECPHYSGRLMTCNNPDSLKGGDIITIPLGEFACQSDMYTSVISTAVTSTTTGLLLSPTYAPLKDNGRSWAAKWSFLTVVGVLFVAVGMALAVLVLKISKERKNTMSSDTEPIIMMYEA